LSVASLQLVSSPIIYNAKVPAKFKEDFGVKLPIEMNVCKPKCWTIEFYDKSENEGNTEKRGIKVYHNKVWKMNYNTMILKHV